MDALNIVKLISCILIWSTLIIGSCALEHLEHIPINYDLNETTTTSLPSSSKTSSAKLLKMNSTTSTTPKPSNNNTTQNSQRISNVRDVENITTNNSIDSNLITKSEELKSHIIHEETETNTKSSIWVSIVVGVLCIAVLAVSVYWYRKRATTYLFVPAATTKARR